MVNLDGEVVGINVMTAKGVDGISFAIPIDAAANIIQQLRDNKKVIRPQLGCRMTLFVPNDKTLDKKIWAQAKMKSAQILVESVDSNSPAHHAGIER